MTIRANYVPHTAFCEAHQKKAFTKAAAKQAIRQMPDHQGMREYRCGLLNRMWHVGHLPRVVLDGELTAADVYPRGFTP